MGPARFFGHLAGSMPPFRASPDAVQHADRLYVLIDQDGVPVRIHQHAAGRACAGFIRFGDQLHALGLQPLLDLAHIGETGDRTGAGPNLD